MRDTRVRKFQVSMRARWILVIFAATIGIGLAGCQQSDPRASQPASGSPTPSAITRSPPVPSVTAATDTAQVLTGLLLDAQDRLATATLRNALTAEEVYYTDVGSYTDSTGDLSAIESAIEYVGYGPAQSVKIGLSPDKKTVCIGIQSLSGVRFYIAATEGKDPRRYAASQQAADLAANCTSAAIAVWKSTPEDGWGR